MTRTKIARKNQNKKAIEDDAESAKENKLRDFDILVASAKADIELKYQQGVEELRELFSRIRQKTPKHILKMTIGEIKEIDAKFLSDISFIDKNITSMSTMSARDKSDCGGKKSKDDEESEGADNRQLVINISKIGPLALSKARKRSLSAGGSINTSTVLKSAVKTPLLNCLGSAQPPQKSSSRSSRSKFRTPLNNRIKAASADRAFGQITPKIGPQTSLAILRHAHSGESVFSISGSPVITSAVVEETANVNIPVSNGILSIRPTEMRSVDPNVVKKIDPIVLNELKQLQTNLNMIVRLANLQCQTEKK
uniref:Putative cell division cycle-associated protein 8 n=1 Tax=Corethrella appendiculata TaxID=1370023 RepID=U5ENB0_9DIPT